MGAARHGAAQERASALRLSTTCGSRWRDTSRSRSAPFSAGASEAHARGGHGARHGLRARRFVRHRRHRARDARRLLDRSSSRSPMLRSSSSWMPVAIATQELEAAVPRRRSPADVRRGDRAVHRFDRSRRPGIVAARELSRRPVGVSRRRHQLVRGGGLREVLGQAPPDDLSLVSRVGRGQSTPTFSGSATSTARALQGRRARGPWSVGHPRHGRQRQGVVRERGARAACATFSAAGGTSRAIASRNRTRRARGSGADTFGVRL